MMTSRRVHPEIIATALAGIWLDNHPEFFLLKRQLASRDKEVRENAMRLFVPINDTLSEDVAAQMNGYTDWVFSPENEEIARRRARWLAYGDLSEEKIEIVKGIEERAKDRLAAATTPLETHRVMDGVYLEISEALDPEETKDYYLYSTTLPTQARAVQAATSSIDLDLGRYLELVSAAQAIYAATGEETSDIGMRLAMVRRYASVLTPEEFLESAGSIDAALFGADRFFATLSSNMSASERVELFVESADDIAEMRRAKDRDERAIVAGRMRTRIVRATNMSNEELSAFMETAFARRLGLSAVE